jgi:hypothetical protein
MNGELEWELIRCSACGREHTRRRGSVMVLPCVRCGEQPEVFSLKIADSVPVRTFGRGGAQVVGREPGGATIDST